MDETIKEILIRRDGLSPDEADDLIEEAKEELLYRMEEPGAYSVEELEDICNEYFGLEPDYLMELMEWKRS